MMYVKIIVITSEHVRKCPHERSPFFLAIKPHGVSKYLYIEGIFVHVLTEYSYVQKCPLCTNSRCCTDIVVNMPPKKKAKTEVKSIKQKGSMLY
jgi:hypothetical protein